MFFSRSCLPVSITCCVRNWNKNINVIKCNKNCVIFVPAESLINCTRHFISNNRLWLMSHKNDFLVCLSLCVCVSVYPWKRGWVCSSRKKLWIKVIKIKKKFVAASGLRFAVRADTHVASHTRWLLAYRRTTGDPPIEKPLRQAHTFFHRWTRQHDDLAPCGLAVMPWRGVGRRQWWQWRRGRLRHAFLSPPSSFRYQKGSSVNFFFVSQLSAPTAASAVLFSPRRPFA